MTRLATLSGIGPPRAVRGYCFIPNGRGANNDVLNILKTSTRPRKPLLRMSVHLDRKAQSIEFRSFDSRETISVPYFTKALSMFFKHKGIPKKLMPTVVEVSVRMGIGGPIEVENSITGDVDRVFHINNQIMAVWMALFESVDQMGDGKCISMETFKTILSSKEIRLPRRSLEFVLTRHPDIFIWKNRICLVERGIDNKDTIIIALDKFGDEYMSDLLAGELTGKEHKKLPALTIADIAAVTGIEEDKVRNIVLKDLREKEPIFIVVGDGMYGFRCDYPEYLAYRAPVFGSSSKVWPVVCFILEHSVDLITKKEIHLRMMQEGFYWSYQAVSIALDKPPNDHILIEERRGGKADCGGTETGRKGGIPYYSLNSDLLRRLK